MAESDFDRLAKVTVFNLSDPRSDGSATRARLSTTRAATFMLDVEGSKFQLWFKASPQVPSGRIILGGVNFESKYQKHL